MPYRLEFFAGNDKNEIIQVDPSNPEWQTIINHVTSLGHGKSVIDQNNTGLDPIQILFVSGDNLRSPDFFHNLCGDKVYVDNCDKNTQFLRRTYRYGDKVDINYKPSPVISIGPRQVMHIYEEAPALDFETDPVHWEESRNRKDTWMYNFGLDHRLKFLDSSIWHRYLAYDDTFDERFIKLLTEIVEYSDNGLFKSLASLATLEFQCRMLQHSYIHKFGDHGHHEDVTPFKFHSETIAAEKVKKFIDFFENEGQGRNLIDLKWNILLIDDYADQNISSIDKNTEIPKKVDLVKKILDQCKIKYKIDHTAGAFGLIQQGIDKLQNEKCTFDLVLLDYLLGNSAPGSNEKSYGYEFLLELATGNNQCARGALGRFWIMLTSSFPFAFSDKLRQLNIDGSTYRWHIANGGDPITTPEFYKLSILRILLRQISGCYLFESALMRQIDRFDGIKDVGQWCNALINRIAEEDRTYETLLSDSERKSMFAETMCLFLSEQKEYSAFLKKLSGWAEKFRTYSRGKLGLEHYKALQSIEKEFPQYLNVIQYIRTRVDFFIHDAVIDIIQKIENGAISISVAEPGTLYEFPEQLLINETVKEIILTGNKLKYLPQSITNLRKLEKIILRNNPDLVYMPAKEMLQMNNTLKEIDIRDTKLGNLIIGKGSNAYSSTLPGTQKILSDISKSGQSNNGSFGSNEKVNVFISYAGEDYNEMQDLLKHLKPLAKHGVVFFIKDQILSGESKQDKISDWISRAHIFLLIFTSNFVSSDEVDKTEITPIEERFVNDKVTVIPVFYNFCNTIDVLKRFSNNAGLPENDPNKPVLSFEGGLRQKACLMVEQGLRKRIF